MNLVDMAESQDAKLYDQAIFKILQDSTVYSTTAEADLQDEELKLIETKAIEIYLSCAFVINSDLKRYGRLIEELENDYTKGNYKYSRNMVKAYQLLNEYKQQNPRATLPESSGVAFLQQGKNKYSQRTSEWKKKATCQNCGQKGHIRPECPEPMTENDDNKKEDNNNPNKKSSNKKLTLNNKSVQFTNINDTMEKENNEDVCAAQYSFAFNTHISTSDDLRHLLLLDNQSTCDIFCNPKFLKNIH